ncbi:hypothetical protein [Streptomyces sp. SYSU K21746]
MTPESPPLIKAAMDHPPTARGFEHLVRKRRAWLSVVLALIVATALLGLLRPSANTLVGMACTGLFLHVPALAATIVALVRTQRIAQILRSYPWQAYGCHYPRRPSTSPTVVEIRFREDYAPLLRVTPFPVLLQQKQNAHPDLIWFAGDPRYGGVISPVGGHFPVRVVPESVPAQGWVGSAEDDVLAEQAGLVTGGKAHQT